MTSRRRPIPLLLALTAAAASLAPAPAAHALPDGFALDEARGLRFFGMINRAGQAGAPSLLPEPGWALVSVANFGFTCMPTAPTGQTPPTHEGPHATGSSYEPLGRPERIVHAAPGVATSPVTLLLRVNAPYNVEGFSHGLMTFDCQHGVTERRGLSFPAAIAGREVLFEPDGVANGLTLSPSLQLAADGAIYARVQDRTEHPDLPYAHPFNHLVRWPRASDASAPELLVSSRDLLDGLLTAREREAFGRYLGWSLRIKSFLPLADGSLWFVLDLNNSRGLRDAVPRSFLFRRAPDGALRLVHTATNPPLATGSGDARLAMERLAVPAAEPLLVVGTAGVASTEPPFRFTWTPTAPGDLALRLVPGHDGPWAVTADLALAPVAFDPHRADLDGDLLAYAAEAALGTSDLAHDTDGDGLHDRHEHLDPALDPRDPADGVIPAPHTRWGISTRVHTAWYAAPDKAAWDTTPYLDGHDPDGDEAPPAARYTADGLPSQITSGWALTETLGVSGAGWLFEGATLPFVASWPADATPLYADEVAGPITYLGPDDVHGAVFVHIPRPGRQPIFRLHPDQRLELLFDASWYGLGPITSMLALTEHDVVLASVGGAYGGAQTRRFVILDAAFAPHPTDLALSPSHSQVARFFGIGYGLADQLEPFAGGYATHWLAELVPVDERLRPGDIVAGGEGLFVLREDLTAHRWLSPEALLALAVGDARDALLARWDELLHREVPPPLDLFPIDEVAVADDASRVAFLGDGRLWELALSDGRPTALTSPAADGPLGVAYLGAEPVVLRPRAEALAIARLDGTVLAEVATDPALAPWRLVRLGPAAAPTWVVLFEGGKARCAGPQHPLLDDVANAVMSALSPDAAVWMRGHRVVAGAVADFCAGRYTELVDRFEGDVDQGQPFATGLSFWKDIARKSWRFSSGGAAAYRIETLPVVTADLAVRPDGGVLVSPRDIGTGWVDILTNALAGTPFFLGAFYPADPDRAGVPAHATHRRALRGVRIGVPLTARQAPFITTGPMARVPGPVPEGWGRVADLSRAGLATLPPWEPPVDPGPGPDPDPTPTPPKAKDDGGCAGGPPPVTPLALLLALVFARRRRAARR